MMIHSCKMCEYENECALKPTSNVVKDCCLFVKKSKQTNADRIRAMSDEELAKWFAEKLGCSHCDRIGLCRGVSECEEAYLQWLKSEVKE